MRALAGALVVCLISMIGMAVPPRARQAAPAVFAPRPLTIAEAELLVLVTPSVLNNFDHGAPVLGPARGRAIPAPNGHPLLTGEYWIQVRTQTSRLLGTYRVDARTAQVFNAAGRRELHGPELSVAQRIIRESHGIAVPTPGVLYR